MLGHTDIHTTLTKYARYIPREGITRASFLHSFNVGSTDTHLRQVENLND